MSSTQSFCFEILHHASHFTSFLDLAHIQNGEPLVPLESVIVSPAEAAASTT